MKYSYTCSETFGKYLLLQKQIAHCGRQRHSRKLNDSTQLTGFYINYLAHSSYLGQKTKFIQFWFLFIKHQKGDLLPEKRIAKLFPCSKH